MICGTIVLEDSILHFRMDPSEAAGEASVHLRVCDALSGQEHEARVTSRAFAASIALALDNEGMDGTQMCAALYALAEPIQPACDSAGNGLRWIP